MMIFAYLLLISLVTLVRFFGDFDRALAPWLTHYLFAAVLADLFLLARFFSSFVTSFLDDSAKPAAPKAPYLILYSTASTHHISVRDESVARCTTTANKAAARIKNARATATATATPKSKQEPQAESNIHKIPYAPYPPLCPIAPCSVCAFSAILARSRATQDVTSSNKVVFDTTTTAPSQCKKTLQARNDSQDIPYAPYPPLYSTAPSWPNCASVATFAPPRATRDVVSTNYHKIVLDTTTTTPSQSKKLPQARNDIQNIPYAPYPPLSRTAPHSMFVFTTIFDHWQAKRGATTSNDKAVIGTTTNATPQPKVPRQLRNDTEKMPYAPYPPLAYTEPSPWEFHKPSAIPKQRVSTNSNNKVATSGVAKTMTANSSKRQKREVLISPYPIAEGLVAYSQSEAKRSRDKRWWSKTLGKSEEIFHHQLQTPFLQEEPIPWYDTSKPLFTSDSSPEISYAEALERSGVVLANNDEMLECDVLLQGIDQVKVPAHQAFLAARCPFFHGMFNGPWRAHVFYGPLSVKDSLMKTVQLDYTGAVLNAVVQYVFSPTNTCDILEKDYPVGLETAYDMISLVDAANFFGLATLRKNVEERAAAIVADRPSMACFFLEACQQIGGPSGCIWKMASEKIRCNPRCLINSSEVKVLFPEVLEQILLDKKKLWRMAASELAYFEIIDTWFQHASAAAAMTCPGTSAASFMRLDGPRNVKRIAMCLVSRHVCLSKMDPLALETKVEQSVLVTREQFLKAYQKAKALHAKRSWRP